MRLSPAALPSLAAAITAAGALVVVVEMLGSRPYRKGKPGRSRPDAGLRAVRGRPAAACVGLACVALGEPLLAVPLALVAWGASGLADRAVAHRRLVAAERALPALAAAVAAALAAGLKPLDALAVASRHRRDPLGQAALRACSRIAAGESLESALGGLSVEFPGTRVVALCSALAVASRSGADASEPVAAIARSSRAADLIRCRERAARAGPLIQLVVALGLVPSVLLLVAAAALAGLGH